MPHEMTPADAFMAAEAALMELDAMARGVLESGRDENPDWVYDSFDHTTTRLMNAGDCLALMSIHQ